MSFVGGGTDLPLFADAHGGAVVSTTINKWVHVIVAPRFEGNVRVSYSRTEIVDDASCVRHDLVREALRLTGLPRGLDVLTLADVPSEGTGLGSSSAITVGLLNALYAYQHMYRSPLQLAEEASQIEIDILKHPIGRQDQYAAAIGGLNLIEFLPRGGGVRVAPIVCTADTITNLHRLLLFFYTGKHRSADRVLLDQQDSMQGPAIAAMHEMRDLAYEMRDRLANADPDGIGHLLHRNWELKRTLGSRIADDDIDRWYGMALDAGATGGKLLGAGGGGFMLIAAPPRHHAAVRKALRNLREVGVRFTRRGTEIILFDAREA